MGVGVKEDIRDLPVGVAMIVGITDQPLVVDIRIRRSEHGGDNVKMQQRYVEEGDSPGQTFKMFQPKVSKDEILFRYRGTDGVDLLKYPLWRIPGKNGFCVDGMTGMLILEKDGLERVPFPKRPPKEFSPRREPSEASAPGLVIEPSIQHESLKKLLSKWKVGEPELVFYPYWLVKKKGKKLLVDAVSEKIDHEATDAVADRV
jgi:hypothetical protein